MDHLTTPAALLALAARAEHLADDITRAPAAAS